MSGQDDIAALRRFFEDLPDRAFVGERTSAGRSLANTFGNPDIVNQPHRRKFFPDPESLDAYLTDTGLDSDSGAEYIFVQYLPNGAVWLYIAD